VRTPAEAKSVVAMRSGAIAYIPMADLDRSVKALRVDP
jgi:hypothetical protein